MTASPSPQKSKSPLRLLGGDRLAVAIMAMLAPVLALIAFGGYVIQEKLDDYRESTDVVAIAQIARSGHALFRE